MAVSPEQTSADALTLQVAKRSRAETIFFWLALAGFPASLTSPGATISFALVAAYGLWLMVRRGDVPDDLRWVGRYMIACYALLLVTDFVNGGGLTNLSSTGVNYLPLVALAPYAYALRRLNLTKAHFDRAMQVTVLAAVGTVLFGSLILDETRPGGLNLNPIPYAFVIGIWGVFQFSGSLANKSGSAWKLLFAGLSIVPLALSESKVSIFCFLLGVVVVVVLWLSEDTSARKILMGALSAIVAGAIVYVFGGFERWQWFFEEIENYYQNGVLSNESFGQRMELLIAGSNAFIEKPVFGHGFLERMQAVQNYAREGGPNIASLGHLHNDYMTHLVSYGIPGAVFLMLYSMFAYKLARSIADVAYRRATVALFVMLASYMCFEIAFNMDAISGAVTLALGMVLCVRMERPKSGHHGDDAVYQKATIDA